MPVPDADGEPEMLKRVSLRAYLASEDLEQRILLPRVPALYIWVFDFHELLGRSKEDIRIRLDAFLQHTGRVIRSHEDAFLSNEWRAVRPAMKPDREQLLVDQLHAAGTLGRRVAELCTSGQRPLYAGITEDLNRRIGQHIRGDSPLTSRLGHLRLVDLALLWTPVAETDLVRLEDEEDVDDISEEIPALRPALAAFESMIIRTSVPTLNEKID